MKAFFTLIHRKVQYGTGKSSREKKRFNVELNVIMRRDVLSAPRAPLDYAPLQLCDCNFVNRMRW